MHIKSCPICGAEEFEQPFNTTDHTVSKKDFTVLTCGGCQLKLTSPRPADEALGNYYKSETYVSHTSSKKGFINSLYHVIRRRTIRQKVRLVKRLNDSNSILDYGCGTGDFLKRCRDSGMRVRGAEPDSGARQKASKSVSGLVSDPDSVFLENETYDTISLWHVLEHVSKLNSTLESLISKLTDKGRLIIAVPNHESYDALSYGPDWAAWDVPRHLWHFTPDSIALLLLNHGMQLEEVKPMWFDSVYVSMLSEKNSEGSMLSALFMGLRSNLKAATSNKPTCSSQIYIFSRFKA